MSTKTEFGLFDSFGPFEMSEFPTAREVYEAHLTDAVEAEQLGYRYYFFIEHQNSPVCAVTAPNIYLTALACRTSVLRFGLMIYQLPFHHPVRLAQDLATLDDVSRQVLAVPTRSSASSKSKGSSPATTSSAPATASVTLLRPSPESPCGSSRTT